MYTGKFEPPGPGAWEIESTHMSRPISRWMAEVFPANMMRGFRESTERYGVLLDYLELAVIEGFVYACPRPVGAPRTAKGPPPKLIFKLLARLHPALRKRGKRAAEVFATKAWRDDLDKWDRVWKPEIVAAHARLAAVELASLDCEGLVAHLEALHACTNDAIYRHHALNFSAMVPVGDFLAHATAWTGKRVADLLALLCGSSPVSVGAQAELERVAAALRSTPQLLDGAPTELLARLRAAPGELGDATRAYLDIVGPRILSGYDVADLCAIEVPEVLVGGLRAALAGHAHSADPAALAAQTAKLREAVPEMHRATFDELLAEARLVYRLRDERCYLNDAYATGLTRLALLEAGARLVAAGKLEARDHAVDLTHTEICALLRDEPGPTKAQTAAYATYRTTKSLADAPPNLGFAGSRPPPAEWLPPIPARMARASEVVRRAMFEVAERDAAKPTTTVRGLPASPGKYEGRARVVLGAEQFARIEQGDVLIARTTSPAYNVLLPLLGGLVTDRGGMLCHAAIVAREYGLPAIVGTTNATTHVPDGARVRLDGETGEVEVLT